MKSGEHREIDLCGGAGKQHWLCECKWWRGRKVGKGEIEILLKNRELYKEMRERPNLILTHWFFAHDGFLHSDRKDLDALLKHLGLRVLPNL